MCSMTPLRLTYVLPHSGQGAPCVVARRLPMRSVSAASSSTTAAAHSGHKSGANSLALVPGRPMVTVNGSASTYSSLFVRWLSHHRSVLTSVANFLACLGFDGVDEPDDGL